MRLLISVFFLFISAQALACSFDSDCSTGYYCDSATNTCRMGRWPDGGCSFDSDCLDGYHCNDGECRMGRWPDGGCSFDSDCLDGYHCNNGECRMGRWPDGGCSFDSDCLDGYKCQSGECVQDGEKFAKANVYQMILAMAGIKKTNCKIN